MTDLEKVFDHWMKTRLFIQDIKNPPPDGTLHPNNVKMIFSRSWCELSDGSSCYMHFVPDHGPTIVLAGEPHYYAFGQIDIESDGKFTVTVANISMTFDDIDLASRWLWESWVKGEIDINHYMEFVD